MKLNKNELEKISNFIYKESGISLDSEKLKRLQRKIESIFKKHNFENFSTFYHRLRFLKDEELIEELINSITINETYFWREPKQFEILAKEILPKFINTQKELTHVRILVAPSSSGEELYSIMIAILEQNGLIEKLNIEMVGIDIDSSMILKAKSGIYSKRSVSKLPTHLVEKYFKKINNFYQIDKNLVKVAKFLKANIFEENLEYTLGKFDIIFSRNMLIYFDKNKKLLCFEQFYQLLKDDSYLFLGHADANHIDKTKFIPLKNAHHIYKKATL